jgi:hypothetical protein
MEDMRPVLINTSDIFEVYLEIYLCNLTNSFIFSQIYAKYSSGATLAGVGVESLSGSLHKTLKISTA